MWLRRSVAHNVLCAGCNSCQVESACVKMSFRRGSVLRTATVGAAQPSEAMSDSDNFTDFERALAYFFCVSTPWRHFIRTLLLLGLIASYELFVGRPYADRQRVEKYRHKLSGTTLEKTVREANLFGKPRMRNVSHAATIGRINGTTSVPSTTTESRATHR